MDVCVCILYILTLGILIYIVSNKEIITEGFQIKCDNKDTSKYEKIFERPKLNYNINKSTPPTKTIDLNNRSQLKSLGYTKGLENNDSLISLYNHKSEDPNYMKMIVDLNVNYVDPNKEINEMCSPPGLCDVDKVKRLFNCGCSDDTSDKCNKSNPKASNYYEDIDRGDDKDDDIIEGFENNEEGFEDNKDNDVIEGFVNHKGYDNYGDFDKPNINNVFNTDIGGGETYIPCGECPVGFERNILGQCQKKCSNCNTYTTDQANQLLRVDADSNNLTNCGDCNMRGNCSDVNVCNKSLNQILNTNDYL